VREKLEGLDLVRALGGGWMPLSTSRCFARPLSRHRHGTHATDSCGRLGASENLYLYERKGLADPAVQSSKHGSNNDSRYVPSDQSLDTRE
jgi:hypothetical protein